MSDNNKLGAELSSEVIKVWIENLTDKRMWVFNERHVAGDNFRTMKKHAETDVAMKIFDIGMTIVEMKWKEGMFGDQELWVTFGKLRK